MEMSKRSLVRLRALRNHVQRSLETIRANESFRSIDGYAKPEWRSLKKVVDILGCRKQEHYQKYTYMRAVAGALESTMAAFVGKESLPDLHHIQRYLSTVLSKTQGGYKYGYQVDILFFLGRFRNKLTNRIAAAQKVLQKKQV